MDIVLTLALEKVGNLPLNRDLEKRKAKVFSSKAQFLLYFLTAGLKHKPEKCHEHERCSTVTMTRPPSY